MKRLNPKSPTVWDILIARLSQFGALAVINKSVTQFCGVWLNHRCCATQQRIIGFIFVGDNFCEFHTKVYIKLGENMAESATPVKLFGKWALDEVHVSDISLQVCIDIEKSISW